MQLEQAWAAGLFEGEGTIVVRPEKRTIQIALYGTDLDIIQRFQRIVGCGKIFGPIRTLTPKGRTGKLAYEWRAYSSNARHVLRLCMPWFGARRRERALQALALKSRQQSRVTLTPGITAVSFTRNSESKAA